MVQKTRSRTAHRREAVGVLAKCPVTTRHNVVDSTPFARDVFKELADECRRQDFCRETKQSVPKTEGELILVSATSHKCRF